MIDFPSDEDAIVQAVVFDFGARINMVYIIFFCLEHIVEFYFFTRISVFAHLREIEKQFVAVEL